jgi:cbb3-type cytochrome oxidase subunit 1
MEATLPISGTAKLPRRPAPANMLASQLGPSVALPMRFVLTAVVSLFVGVIWLVMRPDILATYHYTQYTVAVTHVFTLGWITTLIMGAMYQLVPVALEARLYSERLGRWQFVFHVVGVAGMIWTLWIWDMKQVGHFGSAVGVGMILFIYNIGRTIARAPRRNAVTLGIAASLFWLLLTMLAGLYLAADKCWSFNKFHVIAQIHAHAHLGFVGFFLTLIIGVSYKLVPMFALSEVQSPRRATASILMTNAGLVGVFVTILTQSRWRWAAALVLIAGLAIYGSELRAILKARKRRHLDWGLRYFLTAIGLLAPLSILGLVLV